MFRLTYSVPLSNINLRLIKKIIFKTSSKVLLNYKESLKANVYLPYKILMLVIFTM